MNNPVKPDKRPPFEGCVSYKDLPTGYWVDPGHDGNSVDYSDGWPVPKSFGKQLDSKEDFVEMMQERIRGLEDLIDKTSVNYVEDALRYRWLVKRAEEIYVVPSNQMGKNLSVDSFGDYEAVKNQIDDEIDQLMLGEYD